MVETNLNIESMDGNQISGFGRAREAFAVIEKDGQQTTLDCSSQRSWPAPLTLDGEWEFQPETENALVIGKWLATHETQAHDLSAYTKPDADTQSWLPMVPGAWSYQLPAEPDTDYPIPGLVSHLVPSRLSSAQKLT